MPHPPPTKRRPSSLSMSTRRNRARSPSAESDTSSMSSVELSPPPDTPTTPAIVRKAAQQQREGRGGAGERLQAVLAEREGGEGEMVATVQGDGMEVDLLDGVMPVGPGPEATVPLPNTTPSRGGKATRNSKSTTDRIPRPTNDASSSSSSGSSSSDEDDPAGTTPLFDDALSNTKSNPGAVLKINVNPKQPLFLDLPSADAPEQGDEAQRKVYTYPPSCIPLKYLSDATQQIKLARFLKCRTEGCPCDGLRPPGFPSSILSTSADADESKENKATSRIVLWVNPSHGPIDPKVEGIDALDPSAREITSENLWDTCGACGCGWLTGGAHVDSPGRGGGHTVGDVGTEGMDKDELQRRRRVAYRAEEMLEDVGKLLDFGYMDDDVRGTLKQLEPFQAPHASKTVPTIASTGLKGLPPTGKSLKRTLEDREQSESVPPDSAGLDEIKPDAAEETKGDDDEEDEEDDEDDEEQESKRLRMGSKTGKRGPAGRVPLKTKADAAAETKKGVSVVAPGGQGAGKQMSSKSREPVSIVRKIDGDAIVDDEGNVLDKRDAGVPEEEVEEAEQDDVDVTMDVDVDTRVDGTSKTEKEHQAEEDKLVDDLTNGVTIDMDDQAQLAESLGVDSLDNVDDWADIEFEKLPPKSAMVEYEKGYIKLPVVSSSEPSAASSIVLVGLKNLFQRQLPKMPREYITRLVLDDKHYSMAIVKRGWRVVGGICYRPFESRNFAEIVFCAVESTEQIRGYGSFMMNQVKDYVRKAHPTITHFLTYADNYAIGYFKKQGFSKEITFPRERWVGYIKDYDSANLMMCKMIPRVKYAEVHQMLADQKAAVLAKIQTISQSHVVRPGLALFKDRKPGETITLAKEDIPGLVESGWDAQMDELLRTSIRPPQYVLFQQILNDLVDDANSWPFLKPVDRTVVKDYYDVIAVPMDLQTMELKLESNHYKDLEEFTRDVKLIVANCKQYNGHSNDNSYTKAANALEKAFNKILAKRTAQATGTVIDKKDKKDKK